MVGHAGSEFWAAFSAERRQEADPLDRWSERVLRRIAEETGGHAVFPSDGPPFLPFQQWAMRAEPVFPSPLGLLIHPEYGLWHGYRGALLYSDRHALPAPETSASPCAACAERPCLSTCPVSAFSEAGYDVPACRAYLGSDAGRACLTGSCLARRACPVGRAYHYVPEQSALHMQAFRTGLGS